MHMRGECNDTKRESCQRGGEQRYHWGGGYEMDCEHIKPWYNGSIDIVHDLHPLTFQSHRCIE